MAKRKRYRKPPTGRRLAQRQPHVNLQRTFKRADNLISRGRAKEAVDLLEPLLDSQPNEAELHYYVGYARVKAGNPWKAVEGYKRALELSHNPNYWLPLGSLYQQMGLRAHTLHAYRQVIEHQIGTPMDITQIHQLVAALEHDVQQIAAQLELPVPQAEKGLQFMEEGRRTLVTQDYPASIAASRQAIRLMGDWPPPHNNLSMGLFDAGQPEAAIAEAQQVLSQDPYNPHALSNAIRFLAWTGREAEAQALGPRLEKASPRDDVEQFKLAEAAAALDQDEAVYQFAEPLDHPSVMQRNTPGFVQRAQLLLAVAEANTHRRSARRRLEALQDEVDWAGTLLAALKARQPGPGWAARFPYFSSTELLPKPGLQEFIELAGHQSDFPQPEFRRKMDRLVARFPQVVLAAEKWIWEEEQAKVGMAALAAIATPAAYAALQRFGLSQAGDDETRTQALFKLAQAGQIPPDETQRVWLDGEWREVLLREQTISDQPKKLYDPQVADLLNQGVKFFQQADYEQAERLFRQALALDPSAREAYNNLGSIYSERGDHIQARQMYQAAIEADPTYAFPRCNLAGYLLDEEDIEGAKDMLAPMMDVTHLSPQESAYLSFIQARIMVLEGKLKTARRALESALEIMPDYEPAKALLASIKLFSPLQDAFSRMVEDQRRRGQAKRARLQTKLTTTTPSLSDALSFYTKDMLTGMAQVVLPTAKWSGLRKADLLQQIIEGLGEPDNVARIVSELSLDERHALRQVLASGGSMSWEDFDARYGNDLEESSYWNWHVPQTTMGRLRQRGLLVEATVEGTLLVLVPAELRMVLGAMPFEPEDSR